MIIPSSAPAELQPTLRSGTKPKLSELSLCSVIFCLLVIFIHVSSEPVTSYDKQSLLYILVLSLWRLSSFVVQGFIFLSGLKLFLSYSQKFSYKRYAVSRIKKVVIPYIIVFCLFYVYFILTNTISFTPTGFLRNLFLGDLTSHFYFVVIICQFYLLMPLWRLMARRFDPFLTLVTSLILMMILNQYLPSILSAVFGVVNFRYNSSLFSSYVFYFVFGAFCGIYYEKFRNMISARKISIAVTWGILAVLNCTFLYLNSTGKYYALWLDHFHVLYCIFSILFSLSVADTVTKSRIWKGKISAFFSLLDRASYHIYLIHPLFIFIVNGRMLRAGIASVSLRYLIRIIVTYVVSCGLCMLWQAAVSAVKKKN